MEEPLNMLIIEKQFQILESLSNGGRIKCMLDIVKDGKVTYSHVIKSLMRMQKLGLVRTIREGRKRFATLTDSGRAVLGHLRSIRDITEFTGGDGAKLNLNRQYDWYTVKK